jgi:hypothetical protein
MGTLTRQCMYPQVEKEAWLRRGVGRCNASEIIKTQHERALLLAEAEASALRRLTQSVRQTVSFSFPPRSTCMLPQFKSRTGRCLLREEMELIAAHRFALRTITYGLSQSQASLAMAR